MATISEALAIAIEHHRAGRLRDAALIYDQIVNLDPRNADAWHLLGLIHARSSNLTAAVACLERAVALRPDWPEALANLGSALANQGRPDQAVPYLERALVLRPDYAEAFTNLGSAFHAQGCRDQAIECYRRAVERKPELAEAHGNLGHLLLIRGDLEDAAASFLRATELKPHDARAHEGRGEALRRMGRPDEAIACYRRAIELRPDLAAASNNLGVALAAVGRHEEALDCYRRALDLRPDYAAAQYNLGIAWGALGNLEEAIACYRRAIERQPDLAQAHNNLGNALRGLGRADEAEACYRRALELEPDHAEALVNLGNASRDRGEPTEAIDHFRRAIGLRPQYAEAHNNVGNAFRDRGELDEALACYRRALDLQPDYAVAHSNLLYALHYCPGITPEALAQAHAQYGLGHEPPRLDTLADREPTRMAGGRLRVGFVSPDLGRHPVGYFLVRVLEHLDRQQFETICYSDRLVNDDLTFRLVGASTGWLAVSGMNHQRLAEQIRADRIDILFDLAGHTANNRLPVFMRRPAPVQITWIGYEGTTGLETMDYLIADQVMVPPGSERHHRERVLRMPGSYLCYDPPADAPAVRPPPLLKNGFATFGSFNNPAKITPEVVAAWARVLRAVPNSRLILKYRGMGDSGVRARYLDLFAAHGIEDGRLDLLPWSTYAEYLEAYQLVDVALDPFPFSGSTITCEALWMGVPVITCPGETFASRHALGHLTTLGLTETIAGDLDDYVKKAVSLAGDPLWLASSRSSSRARMAASPLCDGKRFASHFAALIQDIARERLG